MVQKKILKRSTTSEKLFLLCTLSLWAAYTVAFGFLPYLLNFQSDLQSPIFPVTLVFSVAGSALGWKFTGSFWLGLSFPFSFVGIFELAWHAIPNTPPLDLIGFFYLVSWILVGFTTFRRWKIDTLSLTAIAFEAILFAAWYRVGFSFGTSSIVLNQLTKAMLATIFIILLHNGTRSNNNRSERMRKFLRASHINKQSG